MKLFVLHDLEANDESSGALLVRAESPSRAREIAADQDSWKWRDETRTTIEEIQDDGPSGIVWFDP